MVKKGVCEAEEEEVEGVKMEGMASIALLPEGQIRVIVYIFRILFFYGIHGSDFLEKKSNGNGGHRRLKKRYQSIESHDEMNVQEVDDEELFQLQPYAITRSPKHQGKSHKKETIIVLDKETKSNEAKNKSDAVISLDVESKSKIDVDIVDGKTERGVGESIEVQESVEAVPEKKIRKRKGHSEASDLDAGTKQEGDQQAIDKYEAIDN